jgi:hypothetical protein
MSSLSDAASRVRGAIGEILENGSDLHWWEERLLHRVVKPYHDTVVGNDGEYVMQKDWDVLIILDGCRRDLYEVVAGRPVETYVSRGSSTPQFMTENFAGRQFTDTVYVTANPQTNVHAGDSFVEMVNVWEGHWDGEWSTVQPEAMTDIVHETAERYPNKRLIVHFMQPHYPFIDYPDVLYDGLKIRDEVLGNEVNADGRHITPWTALARGDVGTNIVWEAYRHNLKLAYPVARDLARELTGRAVITSDHGNSIGEFAWPFLVRIYGHTNGVYTSELVEVPWDVFEADERREITHADEVSDAGTGADSGPVDERLRDLGYL